MMAFIIVLVIAILSMMYVDRLIKIKIRDEKRPEWKTIHIIAYIITFLPLLSLPFLMTNGDLIKIGILFIAMLLYFRYRKFRL